MDRCLAAADCLVPGEPPKKVKEGKAEGEAERPAEKEKLSSLEPASEVRHVMWLFLGLHPSIIAS